MPLFFNRRIAAATLAVGLLATACGGDDPSTTDGGAPSDATENTGFVDRTYWSTDVFVDGAPLDLVDGTRIQIRFGPDEINADAGCNSLFAGYMLDGDAIVALGAGMTEMGCDPARHAQDDFVVDFLTSRPTFTLDGDTLTLVNAAGTTIILIDKEIADPDRAIDEQAWQVTGFFDELAAWTSAVTDPAVIDFRGDRLSGTSGCGPIPIDPTYELSADQLVLTDEWDLIEWCADADELTKEYAAHLAHVLSRGTLAIEIDGPTLRLTASDGTGLTATAVE